MDNTQLINGLNKLLTKNYDSEQGFKKACENVQIPNLKSYFTGRSQKRNEFGHEIKVEIQSLGGTPDKGTSVTSDMHRAWIDFRSVLNMDNEEAILEECERGEESCLAEYDEFLRTYSAMPMSTRNKIQNQRNIIANTLRNVERLEKTYA